MNGCTQAPVLPTNIQTPATPSTTPIISTQTITPTETANVIQPTEASSLLDNCVAIESNHLTIPMSLGEIILSGIENIGNNLVRYTAYKINMATNEKLEFSQPGENILELSITPDGKWMAYEKYDVNNEKGYLIVTDPSGEKQLNIPWESEWIYISSWLDNNRLLIGTYVTTNNESPEVNQSQNFQVFNPFTKERRILQPKLTDIFEAQGFSGITGRGYNQELDRVVYLKGDKAFLDPLHYILWDMNQKRSLADFEVVIQPTAFPSWSPDGSKFALAASIKKDILQSWPAYELYSVSQDGQVIQLTNLTNYYPWVYIDDYSWSPDGKYIAFWFSWWAEENPGWELQAERYLAVTNIEDGTVTNYCIPGQPEQNGRMSVPVWSPNGKQLVIKSISSDGGSAVVLFDLKKQLAVKIDENLKPEGWMVAP